MGAAALPLPLDLSDQDSEIEFSVGVDEEYKCSDYESKGIRSVKSYRNFSSISQRFGLSPSKQAMLINGLRIDDKETRENFYVSRRKMQNEELRLGIEQIKKHQEISNIVCLAFDGKKGQSMQPKNKFELSDKYAVIMHPGSKYLDFFEPTPADGFHIAEALYHILQTYDSTQSLLVVCSDGTATNTVCRY